MLSHLFVICYDICFKDFLLSLLTSHEAAWCIISVLSLCLISVCLTITFESLDEFIFAHLIYLDRIRVKFVWMSSGQSQDYRRKGRKSLFPQCETSIGNSDEVWVQHGVFGYGGSKGVTAIFVTRLEVTTRIHVNARIHRLKYGNFRKPWHTNYELSSLSHIWLVA